MKLPRRRFLYLAASAVALPPAPRIAMAQAYPSRPVRIIVGYPPGGATDAFARVIAQRLSVLLGQQFIVDNRPGPGGNNGTEVVVRSQPDGYTLLLIFSSNAINATIYDKLDYNFIRDIAPVASIARSPFVIEVHPSVPARTVSEFVTYAKVNPGKIRMASNGNGTTAHVAGELFKQSTGVDMMHVPYRGPEPALTDLLDGKVQVRFGIPGKPTVSCCCSSGRAARPIRRCLGRSISLAVANLEQCPLHPRKRHVRCTSRCPLRAKSRN